jgi:hypothetical protein
MLNRSAFVLIRRANLGCDKTGQQQKTGFPTASPTVGNPVLVAFAEINRSRDDANHGIGFDGFMQVLNW